MSTDYRNIIDLFKDQVTAFPNRPAIVEPLMQCTYLELEEATERLAKNLIYFGEQREELCFVFVKSTTATAVALMSIFKAGKIFVPINLTFPNQLIQKLIKAYKPAWIILEKDSQERLETIAKDLDAQSFKACYYDLVPLENGKALAQFDFVSTGNIIPIDEVEKPTLEPNDPCYIYFTSGSTGNPKAILGAFKGINHFINWELDFLDLPRNAKVSQFSPSSFDAFLRDLFVPLASGGTCCVPLKEDGLIKLDQILNWIEEEGIQLIHCVPSLFRELITLNNKTKHKLSKLKYVLLSGESLYGEDVQAWKATFGAQVQLVNLYGASETTMIKFAYKIDFDKDTEYSIPIGKPITGCKAILLDNNLLPCKQGNIGEIYVRTAYRTLGYYNDKALTEKVFVKHPQVKDPNDLMYKTGDFGRIRKDGNFEFKGRKDGQVKIRGVRVELGAIESVLLQNEIVEDAVVFYDNTTQILAACIRIDQVLDVAEEEMKDYLSQYLPAYMIPKHYAILDAFPKNANGKTDRKQLELEFKKMLKSKTVPFIEPRNGVERTIAEIWKDLLDVESVSIYDNFFEIGGYSLLATRVVAAIQQKLQVDVTLRELFERPTIEAFANFVRLKEKDDFVFGNGFEEHSLMLPLNKLKRNQETIFMLPPILGSSIIYYPLANLFENHKINCIGYQYKGFDRDETFHNSIEEMAKAYFDEMMELLIDKSEPIILFGFSMGALIAFELLRLIEKAGLKCEKLILVDKDLPSNRHWSYTKMRKSFDRKLAQNFSAGDEVEGIMNLHLNDYEIDFPPTELKRITKLLEHSQRVIAKYKPGENKVNADILALEANIVQKKTEKKMHDWKRMTNGSFEHHYINSDHFRILEFHLLPKIVELSQCFIEKKEKIIFN